MTRIDLIPPELVEKQKAHRIILVMSALFLIVFVFLILIYGFVYVQIVMSAQRIEIVRQEEEKVVATSEELKPYEERKKTLDQRQEIVTIITEDRISWSSILNNISMVIPNDVWLKEFRADIEPQLKEKEQPDQARKAVSEPPIRMVGYALEHSAVARWLVHLSEVNQFRSVWLSYSTEKEVEERTLIEFETTVNMTKFSKDEEKQEK